MRGASTFDVIFLSTQKTNEWAKLRSTLHMQGIKMELEWEIFRNEYSTKLFKKDRYWHLSPWDIYINSALKMHTDFLGGRWIEKAHIQNTVLFVILRVTVSDVLFRSHIHVEHAGGRSRLGVRASWKICTLNQFVQKRAILQSPFTVHLQHCCTEDARLMQLS